MYGPATTLALLANMNENVCIAILGSVGTFYTTIGGIRGVIWNDLIQAFVMFTSLAIITAKGVYDVGGLTRLYEISDRGGRFDEFISFNLDPFIRQSTPTLVFGMIIYTIGPYCFDQQILQRFQV